MNSAGPTSHSRIVCPGRLNALAFALGIISLSANAHAGGGSNITVGLVPGAPGKATLSVSGAAGQVYGIQAVSSPSLSDAWVGLFNFTQPATNFVWSDPQPTTLPSRFYRVAAAPVPVGAATWEAADIGTVWSDDFNRASLGSNWAVLGGANVSIVSNKLQFADTNQNISRQVYYQPWQTCSDAWSILWTERFAALNSSSVGVGVGLKNFQAFGGDDWNYNLLLAGAGSNLGKVLIQQFDGVSNQNILASGLPIALNAGDPVDCSLTRLHWTLSAVVSNRANAQVSSIAITFSPTPHQPTPVISRICFYPLGGTVSVDNVSFVINRRKPARFIFIGASATEGWNATSYDRSFVAVVQSNFNEVVCHDSASYNTTTNELDVVPEILAQQPGTAILMIGGNDLYFNVPTDRWQANYSNLVAQLQAAGVYVKHCLPTPRNTQDLRPLKSWIQATYPSNSIIDCWTPLVTNGYFITAAYDSGDGVHPNDAGHLLVGQIVRTNLP